MGQGTQAGNEHPTLRDHFAMAALAAAGDDYQFKPKYLAEYCYERADAMLAARKGEQAQ